MSKDTKPPTPAAPSKLPDGRFYRFVRGTKEYAPYKGVEVLTVKDGVGTLKLEKFPNLPNVSEEWAIDSMHRDVK